MIKAIIYTKNNGLVGFEISGHAGFANAGEDIVCAAVSILATTTVNSLEAQLNQPPNYKVEEKTGYLKCCLPYDLTGDDYNRAQVILKTLEIGLKSIEQEYKDYIKITQRRWNKC